MHLPRDVFVHTFLYLFLTGKLLLVEKETVLTFEHRILNKNLFDKTLAVFGKAGNRNSNNIRYIK